MGGVCESLSVKEFLGDDRQLNQAGLPNMLPLKSPKISSVHGTTLGCHIKHFIRDIHY